MNLAQIILRKLPASRNNLLCKNHISKNVTCQKSSKDTTHSSSSSSSSESDEDTKKKSSPNDAVTKLNILLQQMVSDNATKQISTIKLARPTDKRRRGVDDKESLKNTSVEKQAVNAAKAVAETLGGDTKQTESELLAKLLNPVENTGGAINNLSDILKGMKIEREVKPPQSKAEQVRSMLQKVRPTTKSFDRPAGQRRPTRPSVPLMDQIQPQIVDLYGSEPLGIFTYASDLKDSPQLPTWQKLYEKELNLAITHPPANYFQQMILWTEQGKLWQFPINNEIGLEEESKVYFADHVFLEQHLEPWCPPKGPLRHFMELVCVGLSKNNYLSVKDKREHIEWFKNYFEEKKKLLVEVGAIQDQALQNKAIKKE